MGCTTQWCSVGAGHAALWYCSWGYMARRGGPPREALYTVALRPVTYGLLKQRFLNNSIREHTLTVEAGWLLARAVDVSLVLVVVALALVAVVPAASTRRVVRAPAPLCCTSWRIPSLPPPHPQAVLSAVCSLQPSPPGADSTVWFDGAARDQIHLFKTPARRNTSPTCEKPRASS